MARDYSNAISWLEMTTGGGHGLIHGHVDEPFFIEIDEKSKWRFYMFTPTGTKKVLAKGRAKDGMTAKQQAVKQAIRHLEGSANDNDITASELPPIPPVRKKVRMYLGLITLLLFFVFCFMLGFRYRPALTAGMGFLLLLVGLVTHRMVMFLDGQK